ncbi:unknown [Prevotella sp. CAG:487]|nr:unknown [Prevotella sp. CAG:487]
MPAPPERHQCGAVSARRRNADAEKKSPVRCSVTPATPPLQRKFSNKIHEKQPLKYVFSSV